MTQTESILTPLPDLVRAEANRRCRPCCAVNFRGTPEIILLELFNPRMGEIAYVAYNDQWRYRPGRHNGNS